MRRRLVIGAVAALVLALAGLGAALTTAGGTSSRGRPSPPAPRSAALANQLRVLSQPASPLRRVRKHAPTILIPGGGATSCAVNARGCSLKPCVEFAASAQASAFSTSAPAVDELITPQVVSPRRGARSVRPAPTARPNCRAVPAVGQRRVVPVSLAMTSASR